FAALASANVTKRTEAADVFIHGFVYDIETGVIHDLRVSVGPPGKEIPTVPFTAV
ncbi:hypothetical protein M422DRAFT_80524, partial [Sphaerobolus stellatus SS14]